MNSVSNFTVLNTYLQPLDEILAQEGVAEISINEPEKGWVEKFGLNFVFQNLKNGIAGYFDDKTKTIFINEKYSATRNLFTIAYELVALCVT